MNDIRLALRMLTKNPGFTALIVLTLALGIGSNTAVFSIVNTTFLKALPYPEANRLVFICDQTGNGETSMSYPNYLDLYKQQNAFASLAIYSVEDEKLKRPESSEQISVGLVSHEFFTVLGVNPAQGRGIRVEDDQPGAAAVAWITHQAWQRLFAGEAGLPGKTVTLNGQSVTVAGILPSDFRFIREMDLIRPLAPLAESRFMTLRYNHNGTYGLGRLKAGVSFAAASSQLDGIGKRLAQEYPKDNAGLTMKATPLHERISGWARSQLLLLLGAVALVLTIACVNVATMLLARSVAREREMAIRTALGASRVQLIRQLLTESLLLACAGGVAGTLLGWWGCLFANQLVPWEVRSLSGTGTPLDLRVLMFTGVVTLLTGVAFGLAPAWRLSRACPNEALKRTQKKLMGRFRLIDVLAAAQVALALMLLIGAGLLVRSLSQLTRINPGFQTEHLVSMRVTPPSTASPDPLAAVRFHEEILRTIGDLATVEAATFGSSIPFAWNIATWTVYRDGVPLPAPGQYPSAYVHIISGDYFKTLGIPLLRGRIFDGHETQPVIPPGSNFIPENFASFFAGMTFDGVISQRMADKLWPGENPIGKRFGIGTPDIKLPWVQIVGVVGNTLTEGVDRDLEPELYVALRQIPVMSPLHLLIRTRGAPSDAITSVRAAIRAAGCAEPIFDIKQMSTRVADSLSDRRFNTDLYGFFAGVALLLAATGIYGVLAFNVSQRTREVGLRMALGAQRTDVLRDVLGRGLTLFVPGAVLGVAGAWGVSQLLRSQLFGITTSDPVTYGTAVGLLALTALAACWIPARRAANLDPMVALKEE